MRHGEEREREWERSGEGRGALTEYSLELVAGLVQADVGVGVAGGVESLGEHRDDHHVDHERDLRDAP